MNKSKAQDVANTFNALAKAEVRLCALKECNHEGDYEIHHKDEFICFLDHGAIKQIIKHYEDVVATLTNKLEDM